MDESTSNSPFHKLPLEIRLQIWDYVLPDEVLIRNQAREEYNESPAMVKELFDAPPPAVEPPPLHPLFLINRALHQEMLDVTRGRTKYVIEKLDPYDLRLLFRRMPLSIRHQIREVVVDLKGIFMDPCPVKAMKSVKSNLKTMQGVPRLACPLIFRYSLEGKTKHLPMESSAAYLLCRHVYMLLGSKMKIIWTYKLLRDSIFSGIILEISNVRAWERHLIKEYFTDVATERTPVIDSVHLLDTGPSESLRFVCLDRDPRPKRSRLSGA